MSGPVHVNVRGLALDILLECARGEAYAHDLIERQAYRCDLAHRDAAFLQTLVFCVLRNISLLDTWLDELSNNKRLETRIHWLLRLGVAQQRRGGELRGGRKGFFQVGADGPVGEVPRRAQRRRGGGIGPRR